jgi:hypothetical protein
MLNQYPKEYVDSVIQPKARNRRSPDTVYQGTVVIPYVKGNSEKFSRIRNRFNLRTIFKTKHTLRESLMNPYRLKMPSRRSSVCSASHVIVADVRSVKQADLQKNALRSTNITWTKGYSKIKITPKCVRGRPQNILEWNEGLADWAQHHIQEIQGIIPHVSAGSSDQPTQFEYLSHLDPHYHSRSQESTTPSSVDWVGKLVFFIVLVP